MTAGSADTPKPASNKTRFLNFTLALLVWILGIMVLCGYRFLPKPPPLTDLISPERIAYLLAFFGTILGALGTTKKPGEPVSSRWRDRVALWGWVLVSVGAFAALLFAQ